MKFLIFLLFSVPVIAADLDNASTEALDKTQNLLKSEADRNKFIQGDQKATQADDKVRELSSNKQTQQKVYEASSDIYGGIVHQTGGDVDKQKELLEKAASNPEGFYNALTPEEKLQIQGLADQIGKENPRGSQLP